MNSTSQIWRSPEDQRAFDDARRHVRSMRRFYRHAIVFLAVNLGLAALSFFQVTHRQWPTWTLFGWGMALGIHGLLVWTRVGLLGPQWEARKIAEIMARDQVRTLSTEKQLVEAQMRLLQAQIEPHFLFNTLANVVSLIDPAPKQATMMLEHFIAYLRASLTASRSTTGSVAQEGILLGDYLEVIKIRMGERLRYRIDIDPHRLHSRLRRCCCSPLWRMRSSMDSSLRSKAAR